MRMKKVDIDNYDKSKDDDDGNDDEVKPWTKILRVVNVGSPEKRSNQLKY